jgi:death-on-curing protein
LASPQSGYYEDIIQEAAALWESLSQNHPFVDGNKRVAVTVTAAFMKVNGYLLEFDDLEAFSFLIGLYESGTMQFVELEKWLRVHTKQSDPRNLIDLSLDVGDSVKPTTRSKSPAYRVCRWMSSWRALLVRSLLPHL